MTSQQSGCDQLVVGPTHARGGTLDLLMTDVPDLVWVAVVAPIGNSDHSCESVGKADLLLDHFDSKQSKEAVDLTAHLSSIS